MRIAIVEDETPIREGLAKILNKIKKEYELVGTASDGLEGLALIRETRPDLVIMDIRMPKMDGIAMLTRMREEKIMSKVVILSAYSEFDYARQAIQLGIESYLLKPIDISELRKTLKQIEQNLYKEQNQEQIFSLDNIFRGCLNGQLHPDATFHEMTRQKYGFSLEDYGEIFMFWLGNGYEAQKENAEKLLQDVVEHSVKFSAYVQKADGWNVLFVIVYRQPKGESQYDFFKNSVVPMMGMNLKSPMICIGKGLKNMLKLDKALSEIRGELEWGLLFGDGQMISKRDISKLHPIPIRYPVELESNARKALMTGNKKELRECYDKLFGHFRQNPHLPSEIKENLIRFNWNLVKTEEEKFAGKQLQIQNILQKIAGAFCWSQVEELTEEFFQLIDMEEKESEQELQVSEMIQKALQLIKKYYDQGVTLEEIAGKLFVSEEYLSAQFKKETGATFTETVRKYRIEKVKKLLLETHLKLNQIAELSGYSDPKYMSKVFKEEVGMLPNEYRKSVH